MKKLVFGLLAAATLGAAALPAAAQGVVIRENRYGNVVVHPTGVYENRRYYGAGYGYDRYRYHHAHRVVWFDRWGHRHVEWR
jgi:hypothetical protein